MTNVNICNCCKDIWNKESLQSVNFGNHKIYLCPECFKGYESNIYEAFKGGYNSIHEGNTVKKAFHKWNKG